MSKKKTSIMKYVFIFIVGVILYSLFNKFIWHKYVVHPTAWDALEGEAGQPGVMHDIDHDNRIAVLTPEDGFHVYIVARGFLGWNIEDEISLDRKSTRLNSSHVAISYAVFCLKKKN